jgi:glycosyltransferase involved in cell wall biosynthesis
LGEYLSDWLEVRQVLDADLAFAPSQLMARVYARMECASVEVVRSPFDPPGLVEADSSVYESYLSGKMYLLFFGTLSRVKGADLLGPVASSILARHRDLWFVFVGRDDGLPNHQSVASYVRSCAAGCRDRLMFHTPLPKSQLYPVIAHATGVLMPSRVDNYPNACLEAQALGVPVVGTYGSSLDEMIVDGETGLLADNGDPKAIAHAIERLLAQSTEEARAMRERCLKATEAARVEDRIGQLVSLYQRAQQQFNAGA